MTVLSDHTCISHVICTSATQVQTSLLDFSIVQPYNSFLPLLSFPVAQKDLFCFQDKIIFLEIKAKPFWLLLKTVWKVWKFMQTVSGEFLFRYLLIPLKTPITYCGPWLSSVTVSSSCLFLKQSEAYKGHLIAAVQKNFLYNWFILLKWKNCLFIWLKNLCCTAHLCWVDRRGDSFEEDQSLFWLVMILGMQRCICHYSET